MTWCISEGLKFKYMMWGCVFEAVYLVKRCYEGDFVLYCSHGYTWMITVRFKLDGARTHGLSLRGREFLFAQRNTGKHIRLDLFSW